VCENGKSAPEGPLLERPVCALMLRHSYAVRPLRAGMNIRARQAALGLRYLPPYSSDSNPAAPMYSKIM